MSSGLTSGGGYGDFFNRLFGRQAPKNGPPPKGSSRGAQPQDYLEEIRKQATARQQAEDRARSLEEEILEDELRRTRIPDRQADPADEWIEGGEWFSFPSSNVMEARYEQENSQLFIAYHDGSIYQYQDVSEAEARAFYEAPSKGGWCWDNLRVRGTVFGYQKSYQFLSGPSRANRGWMKTARSRARHGRIPPSGRVPGTDSLRPYTPKDLHRS